MYTAGAIVVIRGGTDVAGLTSPGLSRSPSLAKILRIVGDVAMIQRARGRGGQRFQHWGKPCGVPLDAIVREATRRELVLGYPSEGGPPLREVTL